jgi:hypothetical protein
MSEPTREIRNGILVYSKELYVLCSSPNIFVVVKSRKLLWAGKIIL